MDRREPGRSVNLEASSPSSALLWSDRHPRAVDALRLVFMAAASAGLLLAAYTVCGGGSAGLAAAFGIAAGFATAGHAREGPKALVATLVPAALLALMSASDRLTALITVAAALLLIGCLAAALRRTAFDWRLDRARDLAWLVGTGALAAVACAGFVPSAWVAIAGPVAANPLEGLGFSAHALLVLAGFLGAALPTCTWVRAGRRPNAARLWVWGTLSLALFSAVVAPTQAFQGGMAVLWWLLPFIVLLPLAMLAGSAWASTALLLVCLGIGWTSLRAAYEVLGPSLVLVLCLQALLLVAHGLRAEAAWRLQRWEWALDGSRLGVADWHLRSGDNFVSAAWRSLARFDQPDWTPQAWVQAVHPDDQAELRSALEQVSSGQTGRLRLELRMSVDSVWRWLEATLLVIEREANGVPVRLLATLADVDERHDAQERQRLSVSLFQHLHEGLLITDSELRVLDANPAYTQILGVTRADMLGSVPSLLRPHARRPVGTAATRRDVGRPARNGRLAWRAARASTHRRDLFAAGHHLLGYRPAGRHPLPRAGDHRRHRTAGAT